MSGPAVGRARAAERLPLWLSCWPRARLPWGKGVNGRGSAPPHPQSRRWDEWPRLPLGSRFGQRPQYKDVPVLCSKHNCDRGSQKSKPRICRRSARLAALLMNPSTVSMGSLLGHTDLSKRPPSELQSYPLLTTQAGDPLSLMLLYHLPVVGPTVDQPTIQEKDLPPCRLLKVTWNASLKFCPE